MHLSLSGIRLLLHFICYSHKYSYSHLTNYIPTEACNYLAGSEDKPIINTDLIQKDIKKNSIIYYCRYFAQQKVLFLEKHCVIVGQIETERSYVKQSFQQETVCLLWSHWNKEF